MACAILRDPFNYALMHTVLYFFLHVVADTI